MCVCVKKNNCLCVRCVHVNVCVCVSLYVCVTKRQMQSVEQKYKYHKF